MNKRISSLILAAALTSLGVPASHAQDIQARTIKFGHLNNTDHPISAAVKKFGELVAAKSGGKFVVKEFPSNQLGTEQQQTSALQGGIQEMQSPATTSLVGIVKDYGVIDFPFTVSNYEQAFALMDGPLGSALLEKLPEKGLIGLGYWDLGFRNVTNSKHPIAKLEDWTGLKLRVIPNPVYLETFNVLKANPVPMSFSELYSALETKTVDGQENPFAVIRSNKFFEVQKYLSATKHVYSANVILVSKKFWDKLSPAEQKILKDSFVEARDYQRKISMEAAAKAVEALKAGGMDYNEVSAEEQARMRAAVKPTIDKFLHTYDPAIQKLFISESARIQPLK